MMIFRNRSPSFFLPSNRKVNVAGNAPCHLAAQETEDDVRVALDSISIAEIKSTIVIIDVLRWPIAERGQSAPRVEAEHAHRDDEGQVEADAEAMANASYETGLHFASADKHAQRPDGKEPHNRAAKCIDHAESVALRPAIIVRTVCTAVIFDVREVLGGLWIVAVVFGPVFPVIIRGQLVIEVTKARSGHSDLMCVGPKLAHGGCCNNCVANMGARADS